MTPATKPFKMGNTREQILAAAAKLFAKLGYNGVSTREIARLAKVNEITIYRYYPKKHLLFEAAVESEVQKLRIRPELMAQLNSAPDMRSSLRSLFDLLSDVLAQRPDLARLLQFSALEFGTGFIPLYRRYLGDHLDLGVSCLQRWEESGELRCQDLRILILAFAATIVSVPTFYPALWGEKLPPLTSKSLVTGYADVWRLALGGSAETA